MKNSAGLLYENGGMGEREGKKKVGQRTHEWKKEQ